MRALTTTAIIAVATAVAAPAFAQDAPARTNFTGPRIEAHVGYDRLGTNNTNGGIDGVTYGVGAGYDFALGSGGTILGVEVNADFSNTDAYDSDFDIGVKAKRDLDASVRLGTSLGTNGLIYAKVGYANSRFRVFDNSPGGFSISDNLEGVRAGIGYEYAVSRNVYVKAEYRYTNYEQGVDRNQGIAGVGFRF